MFLLFLNLKEQQKLGRSPFTLFLISLLVPKGSKNGSKNGRFRNKIGQNSCLNQSKSIKFVMSCAGHVDGIKNK